MKAATRCRARIGCELLRLVCLLIVAERREQISVVLCRWSNSLAATLLKRTLRPRRRRSLLGRRSIGGVAAVTGPTSESGSTERERETACSRQTASQQRGRLLLSLCPTPLLPTHNTWCWERDSAAVAAHCSDRASEHVRCLHPRGQEKGDAATLERSKLRRLLLVYENAQRTDRHWFRHTPLTRSRVTNLSNFMRTDYTRFILTDGLLRGC